MGVTYKLTDEVVQFIVNQRQNNPLASCRQLAESTSEKFGLHLSKSSVHDVLKGSGIVTPRGRKPKDSFEIPQEKKKQIQKSLLQVKWVPDEPMMVKKEPLRDSPPVGPEMTDAREIASTPTFPQKDPEPENIEISPVYEGAGKVFLKAALWDLGISSEENIKKIDWDYYLTYSKGIKVVLENGKNFFIDLSLPLERAIRETVDGLVSNVKPFIVHKVSDEELFKACMEAQNGYKINIFSIVDELDHELFIFDNIMEYKRTFLLQNRVFVHNNEKIPMERLKSTFFPQIIGNNYVIDKILDLKGFDTKNNEKNGVTLYIDDSYENEGILKEAAEKLTRMFIYDDQNRLVNVKIQRP